MRWISSFISQFSQFLVNKLLKKLQELASDNNLSFICVLKYSRASVSKMTYVNWDIQPYYAVSQKTSPFLFLE